MIGGAEVHTQVPQAAFRPPSCTSPETRGPHEQPAASCQGEGGTELQQEAPALWRGTPRAGACTQGGVGVT